MVRLNFNKLFFLFLPIRWNYDRRGELVNSNLFFTLVSTLDTNSISFRTSFSQDFWRSQFDFNIRSKYLLSRTYAQHMLTHAQTYRLHKREKYNLFKIKERFSYCPSSRHVENVWRHRDIYYFVIRTRIVYIYIYIFIRPLTVSAVSPSQAGWITNVIPNGIRGGVPLKFSFDRRFVIPPEEIPFGEAIKFYDAPNESASFSFFFFFFPPFFLF